MKRARFMAPSARGRGTPPRRRRFFDAPIGASPAREPRGDSWHHYGVQYGWWDYSGLGILAIPGL